MLKSFVFMHTVITIYIIYSQNWSLPRFIAVLEGRVGRREVGGREEGRKEGWREEGGGREEGGREGGMREGGIGGRGRRDKERKGGREGEMYAIG